MIELEKKFRFETAHKLSKSYCGKCSNIHGHSWNGSIKFGFNQLDQYDFGLDYSEIKTFTKEIEDGLDHKLLLHESEKELIDLCKKQGLKVVIFSANPTSEILALHIFYEAKKFIRMNNLIAEVLEVQIEETCTSRCTIKIDSIFIQEKIKNYILELN